MLSAVLWFFAIVNILNVILAVFTVGKQRKPITPGQAAISIIISMAVTMACFYALFVG